jgi:hypothetical protein
VDVELPSRLLSAISVDRKKCTTKKLANENSATTTPFSSTAAALESFRITEKNRQRHL